MDENLLVLKADEGGQILERKIFSMSVFEFFVNLVGWRVQGAKNLDDILSQNSDILIFVSAFK